MLKTQAERLAAVESVLGNMRLEGLKPSKLGERLFQSYVKGEITIAEVKKALNRHYQDFLHAKVA